MNKAILIGNLAKNPEIASTNSGISVCRFSIACNRPYTNADGERECDFLNIVTWRGLADNCGKYLNKGNKVAITGSIQTRSYEDNEGNKRYVTEIVADEVEFLSPRAAEEKSEEKPKKGKNNTAAEITAQGEAEDGFPF